MKRTDFAHWVGCFLTLYLVDERGCSPLTVDSYRVAVLLYLDYMEECHKVKAVKMELKYFTKETVEGFLDWLQKKKGATARTRNQKLAALKSFARYLVGELPDYLEEYQKILAIRSKKAVAKEISYLKTEGVELLVKQIDMRKKNGLRDLVMRALLYTVGLRVSELTAIKVGDLNMTSPASLLVHGKGRKTRYVPLLTEILPHLREYLKRMKYDIATDAMEPLFKNHLGQPFNRRGIAYLVNKYAQMARKENPELIPEDLSPHKLRHTAAMELLASGVDLIRIRDLLGHSSVVTTEIYAKIDSKQNRKAIEKASKHLLPPQEPKWENNKTMKEWLKSLSRQ